MTDFKRFSSPRYQRGWFTAAYGLIGVLTLAALLLVAAPGWEYAVQSNRSMAASSTPWSAAFDNTPPVQTGTGVPDASLVFQGNLSPPEPQPPTF